MSVALKEKKDTIEEQSTKHKIFMVAARLMAEKGYNGVSMREISEQSGVSKPTIYYYFGNKEGIFRELVETSVEHIMTNFKRIKQLNIPVKEKLVRLAKNHFQQCIEHPEVVKFMFSLIVSIEEIPFLKEIQEKAFQKNTYLVDIIQEGKDSGEFGESAKPELAAEIITGALSHFFWLQLNSKKMILSDNLAEEIVEFLFKGLNE